MKDTKVLKIIVFFDGKSQILFEDIDGKNNSGSFIGGIAGAVLVVLAAFIAPVLRRQRRRPKANRWSYPSWRKN